MNNILPIIIALSIMFLSSCKGEMTPEYIEVDTLCSCPHTTICLLPMDDFSQKEAEKFQKELMKHITRLNMAEVQGVEVLPNKELNQSLLNDSKTRYRADKIVRYVQSEGNARRTIIALTHKDISVPLRGHKDWGVMGLSLQPGTACVVSTYRVKDRSQLWKVALHEFCHTYYNMPHCHNDDRTCFMKDAKGKERLSSKTKFCKDCMKYIEER